MEREELRKKVVDKTTGEKEMKIRKRGSGFYRARKHNKKFHFVVEGTSICNSSIRKFCSMRIFPQSEEDICENCAKKLPPLRREK